MKLLIHDFIPEQWKQKEALFHGYRIIGPNDNIHPCTGCFSCWKKTPGRCVIKDGFDQMGAIINDCEELVINTRFTYGGFSSFVKNVFDRSLGYVLPYFEVSQKEMHHKRRYEDVKKVTFIFRGNDLSQKDSEMAVRYCHALCRNLRGEVKEVLFENEESNEIPVLPKEPENGKAIILNCSPRLAGSNSQLFINRFTPYLTIPFEQINITPKESILLEKLQNAETLIITTPLYVDGLPSQLIRILEKLQKAGRQSHKNIYVIANMGLYESRQLENLLAAIRKWCEVMGYRYKGAAAIGAGELLRVLVPKVSFGPVKPALSALKQLAKAVNDEQIIEDIYADPYPLPRSLYIACANLSWDSSARKAGMKPADLYVQLIEERQ